jgi:AsmA-like C-terminal region
MKLTLKILKISAILVLAILIILFSASVLMQDKVAGIILRSLNQNISTKLKVGSVRLSLLKKFPKASLELKDVLVHSSTGFKTDAFGGISTDTLLSARSVSVEFRLTDILSNNYTIERIRARAGRVNFFTDAAGNVNYDITVKSSNPGKEALTINLEKIYLTDIKSYYNNLAAKLIINGIVRKSILKSRIQGKNIGFTADGELQIDSLQLLSTRITRPITGVIDLSLQKTAKGITFKKGIFRMENWDFGLDGFVSSDNVLDLNITGHNIDISKIRNWLPERYLRVMAEYGTSGILEGESRIRGLLSRTVNPHIEINWRLSKGRITYANSHLAINNLSLTGNYSNGSKNRPETASLSLKDIKARLGSSDYQGSLTISRLNNPLAEVVLRGRAVPGELREFFGIQQISSAGGYADIDIKAGGALDFDTKNVLPALADINGEANLVFNAFRIGFNNEKYLFEDVNGSLTVSGISRAKNLKLTYRDQRIAVDGEFRNLLQWMAGRPVTMVAIADVSFSRFIPEAFRQASPPSRPAPEKRKAFSLPGNMIIDLNFKIDSLTYKTFSSSKISGALNYKPKLLTFKSLNMKSMMGSISGNGFILQNSDKSVLSKGIFNVTRIDVNKAFTSFRNFGQNFLKAENIAGSLSGSFSLLLPLDSLLHPKITALTAEGKYTLINGALINFEPVKKLSSFIELSELENISFAQMQNDFFIRNNYLYIPQMEVNSSAVDLSVNGRHSLDNDYEYHVKVLLSEILSKKRKKNKKSVTEFGTVEDDGLGRTSMLLKIKNKGEEVKVSYDIRAAAGEIKEDIKKEKKTLKTILNKEYGWYKNDTSVVEKPAAKKPKFRVTWEENEGAPADGSATDPGKSGKGSSAVKKK